MSALCMNSAGFRAIAKQILAAGHRLRFQASGVSMRPFILSGDIIEVAPLVGTNVKRGDVLLVETGDDRLLAHRLIKIDRTGGISGYLLKGDSSELPNELFRIENILGRVEVVQRGSLTISLTSPVQRFRAWLWVTINPWVDRLPWLPAYFRHIIRHWLVVE